MAPSPPPDLPQTDLGKKITPPAKQSALLRGTCGAPPEALCARRRVVAAVAAVVRSAAAVHISKLLEETRTVQAELIGRRVLLRFLHRSGFIDGPPQDDIKNFLVHNNDCLPGTIGSVEFSDWARRPALELWRAAAAALHGDADATLPLDD
jgi:hypothetical protein